MSAAIVKSSASILVLFPSLRLFLSSYSVNPINLHARIHTYAMEDRLGQRSVTSTEKLISGGNKKEEGTKAAT